MRFAIGLFGFILGAVGGYVTWLGHTTPNHSEFVIGIVVLIIGVIIFFGALGIFSEIDDIFDFSD